MNNFKLIMTWDIAPEREQEYFEFVVREFIPGVQKLGFELTDAWATIYGGQPQIMVGATLPSLANVQRIAWSRREGVAILTCAFRMGRPPDPRKYSCFGVALD